MGRNPLTAESTAINLPLDIAALFRVSVWRYFAFISFLSTQDSRFGFHEFGRLLWRVDSETIAEFNVKKEDVYNKMNLSATGFFVENEKSGKT